MPGAPLQFSQITFAQFAHWYTRTGRTRDGPEISILNSAAMRQCWHVGDRDGATVVTLLVAGMTVCMRRYHADDSR
jgi:hypothetical protein